MRNLFVDMDGCLCKYEPEAYQARPDHLPKYLTMDYYETVEPDLPLIRFVNQMGADPRVVIWVLTRVPYESSIITSDILNNMIECKREWLISHGVSVPLDHILITDRPKHEFAIELLGRKLTKDDMLIDDFNENLKAWYAAGGSAYKYINEFNSVETAPCLFFGFGDNK